MPAIGERNDRSNCDWNPDSLILPVDDYEHAALFRNDHPPRLFGTGQRACTEVALDRPSLQFPAGVKPIFVRRTIRTTSRLPESISLERDVFVSKTIGAVSDHVLLMSLLRMPARLLRVLKCAPRKLMPGFVILLFMSFGRDAVSVRGFVVQLGGSLMILVVRSVVVSGGHSEFSYLTGLIMRLFSQRVSMIGILQRSFVMPVAGWIVAFFVVFRSSAMGLRRQFMLFGGFSM